MSVGNLSVLPFILIVIISIVALGIMAVRVSKYRALCESTQNTLNSKMKYIDVLQEEIVKLSESFTKLQTCNKEYKNNIRGLEKKIARLTKTLKGK